MAGLVFSGAIKLMMFGREVLKIILLFDFSANKMTFILVSLFNGFELDIYA